MINIFRGQKQQTVQREVYKSGQKVQFVHDGEIIDGVIFGKHFLPYGTFAVVAYNIVADGKVYVVEDYNIELIK